MMRGANDFSEQSRLYRFVTAWGVGVRWLSIILSCAFIPVMVFGLIVFPESRVVAAVALPILTVVAWWNLRALRLEKRERDTAAANPQPD
jgi:hypothetical protein